MYTLEYNIVARTPVGCRVGELTVNIEEGEIAGTLTLPFFSPKYDGKIDSTGNMEIHGMLFFDGTEYEYVGKGRISPYAICIQISVQDQEFEISGTSKRWTS